MKINRSFRRKNKGWKHEIKVFDTESALDKISKYSREQNKRNLTNRIATYIQNHPKCSTKDIVGYFAEYKAEVVKEILKELLGRNLVRLESQ